MIFQPAANDLLQPGAVRQAFRSAFFRGAAVSVPVLALHALLLAWNGETAWALLPVAAILLICTAYTFVAHAADRRPSAAVAVPAAFTAAYCLVMAFGFGPAFGFHGLLIVLLPLALSWEKAGDAGKWGAAALLCLLVLWVELGGGAFLLRGETLGPQAELFRWINLTAALLLLAAFTRIALDFKAGESRRSDLPDASARPERRRPSARPYPHFPDPDRVFSVIVAEIDHHAALAEIFGREAAEEVARHVSALIVGAVRETDMIGRRGHGAFVIFLPETVEEEAYAVAERIRALIAAAPAPAGETAVRVSATLGVAQSASNADMAAAMAEAESAVAAGRAAGYDRTMLAGLL